MKRNQLGIIEALTIGDRYNITSDTNNIFVRCGLSHMLAISGFHLSLIFMTLFKALNLFGLNNKIKSVICIVCAVFYAALTGFSLSVTRALVAFIVVMLGNILNQQPDTLNSLGLASVIILLINPFAIVDIGFLLSVLSLLGIVVLLEDLNALCEINIKNRFLKKLYSGVYTTFNQSLSATVFIIPILALFFGSIPVFSPIINIVANIPILIIMYLSVAASILSLLPFSTFAVKLLFVLANFVTKYTLKLLSLFSSLKFVTVSISFKDISVAVLIVLVIVLITVFAEKLKIYKILISFTCICIIIIFSILGKYNVTEKTYISYDNFCSAVIKNNSCVVIGTGRGYYSYSKLDKFLSDNNINKIDAVIIPSDEINVYGGLPYLLNNYYCKTVITDLNYNCCKYVKKIKINNINNCSLSIGNSCNISFLKNGFEYVTFLKTKNTNLAFTYKPANLKAMYNKNIDMLITGKALNNNMVLKNNQYVFNSKYLDISNNIVYNYKLVETDSDFVFYNDNLNTIKGSE